MTTPRARRTDAGGSHAAAAHSAGTAATQREIVLQAVRDFPGETSAELAQRIGIDRVDAARRLPELRGEATVCNGRKRKCRACHEVCLTWFPTRAPARPQQLFKPGLTVPRCRRSKPARLADLPPASPPPIGAASIRDPAADELLDWFRSASEAGTLSQEPFDLRPGERVGNPALFYAALRIDIAAGPTAFRRNQIVPTARWSPLLRDLQRLRTITQESLP